MPKMLADEGTEYDDGTPATESQQAKVSILISKEHICVTYHQMSCTLLTSALHTVLR